MSNYRRLISYIYAYEGGVKGKNIGFAKIESRGVQCKIGVNVKKVYVGGNDIGVYLLCGESEICIGKIFVRNGGGEFRTVVSYNDVEHSGVSMDQCYGLTIHEKDNAWQAYTTIWEDAVAQAAEIELESVTAANRVAQETKKTGEDASVREDLKMEAVVREIEEEVARAEEAGRRDETAWPEGTMRSGETAWSEGSMRSGEMAWAEGSMSSGEMAWAEEERWEDEAARAEKANRKGKPARAEEASRKGEAARAEEASREGETARAGEENREGEPARAEKANREGEAARAGEENRKGETARVGEENRAGETARAEEDSQEDKAAWAGGTGRVEESGRMEAAEPSGSATEKKRFPDGIPAGESTPAGERAARAPGGSRAAGQNAVTGDRTVEENTGGKIAGGGLRPLDADRQMDREENRPAGSVPDQADTPPGEIPLPSVNSWRRTPGQAAPPSGPRYSGRPVFNPAMTAGRPTVNRPTVDRIPENGTAQPDQEEQRVKTSFPDSLHIDQPDRPPVGNPEELDRLQREDMLDAEEGSHEQIWEEMKREHTKIPAFDYERGCEILVIKPQDIGRMPRENWVFGNNSFMLHGYYNFRYLILAKLNNPGGIPRYLLGVPGHYYNNEKNMASMFGFPNFVLSKQQPVDDGRFGYWYTDIKLGN